MQDGFWGALTSECGGALPCQRGQPKAGRPSAAKEVFDFTHPQKTRKQKTEKQKTTQKNRPSAPPLTTPSRDKISQGPGGFLVVVYEALAAATGHFLYDEDHWRDGIWEASASNVMYPRKEDRPGQPCQFLRNWHGLAWTGAMLTGDILWRYPLETWTVDIV